MHLLELAKTAWNKIVITQDLSKETEFMLREQVQMFLARGQEILTVFGVEGDEDGPLKEIELLQSLLNT
jgi:hypothetical protein